MPKGRIGLSLSEDVLAILKKYGRTDVLSMKEAEEACIHPDYHKRPTRTQLIERGVRLTGALSELALEVLALRAETYGLTQQDYIEAELTDSLPVPRLEREAIQHNIEGLKKGGKI